MSVNRREFLQCAAAAAAGLNAVGCGDSDDAASVTAGGLPGTAYFNQLARDLTAAGIGTPQVVIDLDRLDANTDAIVHTVGRERYRIVEKSLPSLDLLGYVSTRTGSDRFLVLHLPFLPAILAALPRAEVLIGKSQLTAAVEGFFTGYAAADRAAVAARVRFLVDNRRRLDELAALASRLGLTLQVGVEVDVGLHRGGVRRPGELAAVVEGFTAHAAALRFAGMLGYDGHVPYGPVAPGLEEVAARAAFRTAMANYQSFVNALRAGFPSLVGPETRFNGGGSATYSLYPAGPVNDVAIGGGVLRPASYPAMFTSVLRPAMFIAAPVLASFSAVELPFASGPSASVLRDQRALAIYGGGWAAEFVSPPGLSLAPLVSDPENQNLVPNQTLLVAPRSTASAPDDWIFQHPRQSDAIFQFENILLVRGGRLQSDRWRAFPRRY